jgi:N6-L-threonylcarbamoyladenine synthase
LPERSPRGSSITSGGKEGVHGATMGSPMPERVILGLETSCDETAAALITDDGEIRSNVVSSQADLHARYGGVVPEVASRRHLELVTPVIREALGEAGAELVDLRRVAVTRGPGLIGALLVGLSAAKALAWALRLPLVPVDHLHGHVASLFLRPAAERPVRGRGPGEGVRGNREVPPGLPLAPPFLCLLASGGHTLLLDVQDHAGFDVLGSTLDDAAGEAFDKGARLLGLGYPGGAAIDRLAKEGDAEAFDFPVARVPGLDFSFSGLKTALLYKVRDLGDEELERRRADLAASYQRAIIRALVERTEAAAAQTGAEQIAVVGGVAANSELRAALPHAALAPLELCTDNAAMIASASRYVQEIPFARYLGVDAYASTAA